MAEIKLQADDTRIATIKFEDGAGADKDVTIPKAGGLLNVLTQGTAVAATGTAIDFTGIPSTAKRITVMFGGVSTNGVSAFRVQIGSSGGFVTTGYSGSQFAAASTNSFSAVGFTTEVGFPLVGNRGGAVSVNGGVMYISNQTGNTWQAIVNAGEVNTARAFSAHGYQTLPDVLDRLRITTVNGTDQFDAGTINIMWE